MTNIASRQKHIGNTHRITAVISSRCITSRWPVREIRAQAACVPRQRQKPRPGIVIPIPPQRGARGCDPPPPRLHAAAQSTAEPCAAPKAMHSVRQRAARRPEQPPHLPRPAAAAAPRQRGAVLLRAAQWPELCALALMERANLMNTCSGRAACRVRRGQQMRLSYVCTCTPAPPPPAPKQQKSLRQRIQPGGQGALPVGRACHGAHLLQRGGRDGPVLHAQGLRGGALHGAEYRGGGHLAGGQLELEAAGQRVGEVGAGDRPVTKASAACSCAGSTDSENTR
jgi:hypothetical protein